LRADPRFQDVPLLLLSGQTDAATKRAGFEAGADDFIAKPFVPDELLARVDAQIRRRQRA
jgi:DNA-binding response OmpR family regulator